jgi:hypothetical protein
LTQAFFETIYSFEGEKKNGKTEVSPLEKIGLWLTVAIIITLVYGLAVNCQQACPKDAIHYSK